MKIAFICSMKRGLPSFIYREIKGLYKSGIDVYIFTTKSKPGLYKPEKEWHSFKYNSFIVILLQPLFFIRHFTVYFSLLIKSIKTNSLIDFLIAFYYVGKMKNCERIHCIEAMHALYVGYYCSKILKIPLSVTIHADTLYDINPNTKFTKNALKYCNAIVSPTEYNKKILIDDYGIKSERISLIRMGVDIEKFKDYKKKSILIVGQWCERKGHEDLFKAFKKIDRDDVDLWIVGSGTWGGKRDYVDLKKLVKKYGIEDKSIFFERIPEKFLQYLYSQCTIFCLPSKKSSDGNCEGLPISLMEAMASYKPVVSTLHTGIPELVNKVLVPEGDWLELSKALEFLLSKDDKELRKMGEENRKIVEKKYSFNLNIKKLAELFYKI